jgi:uncharacterized protein YcbK (DUF882 family)
MRPTAVRASRGRRGTPLPLRGGLGALLLFGSAAVGVVQFYRPAEQRSQTPFAHLTAAMLPVVERPNATATPDAFGRSGEVKVRFALPGESTEFPLAIAGRADSLMYEWVSVVDSAVAGPSLPLTAAPPTAPVKPGFYHLAVVRDTVRQIIDEPTLAVLMPFDRKLGQWLNGYRIGTYLAEHLSGKHEAPAGFIEVTPGLLGLSVSKHLKLADFVTHDDQDNVWPKYVALNPRLLDKLELVIADVGSRGHAELRVDVHSGFRAPSHNREVRRAARDSRHQYGDAADVQIDANGDGKITMADQILVMRSVQRVEEAHPDLVGGLGMYGSSRYRTPYLHIDTRGKRSRWHG